MHAELVAHSRFFSRALMPDFIGLLAEAALVAGDQAELAPRMADSHQCCGWFDSTYELQQGLTVIEDDEITEFRRCEAEALETWAMLAAPINDHR